MFNQKLLATSLSFSFNNNEINVTKNNNDEHSRFQFKKLNFFNLKYDEKTTFKIVFLKNINEKIVHRNVHVFINRAKNFVKTHDENVIRINFYRCIKNIVSI